MEDYFLGSIVLSSHQDIPDGWLPCDGRKLLVKDYAMLFTIIRRTYTESSLDKKYFRLPSLIDRIPIGASKENLLGQSGGSDGVSIEIEHLPMHRHDPVLNVSSGNSSKIFPATDDSIGIVGVQNGRAFTSQLAYTPSTPNISLDYYSILSKEVGAPDDVKEPMSVVQPVLGLHFIICFQGIYPTKP
ncbi:MAG: tail fiber protein [Gilvibacter sp.]